MKNLMKPIELSRKIWYNQLERVHINRDARLFGKFYRICRQKSLKYGRIPADFFLKYGKIMLKNPHISFM